MKTYRVLRQCNGFKRRMWFKDQVVTLEDNEKPPYHFQLVEDSTKSEPIVIEKPKPITLAELGKQPVVVGGMNTTKEVLEQKRRGRSISAPSA